MTSLLSQIHSPSDLRRMQPSELKLLAGEIRRLIIEVVSTNAGHLGASLGAVELAIALHYVFDTPHDRLVWDVGHQAYAHKILTGRRQAFASLRRWGGINGFPVRDESPYDCFGTGHASTALSAALGMAIAARIQGHHLRQHIAVVGDGALTGGMFFEALNQAGGQQANLLIVLNDNNISIDNTSGALRDYLHKVRQGQYASRHPLFEAFGVHYLGLVNGHDTESLIAAFEKAKQTEGLRLLHVLTTKGKGFGRAEQEQVLFHAPGRFDPETGKLYASTSADTTLWQHVLGNTLAEMAQSDLRIVAITPAMPTGSSLDIVARKTPERMFDVDIAEQHALTFAAGLAAEGLKPFCVVYSTFLQRAMDQLIHDIALQNLPVVLCVDRAGLVGEDGATHQGAFDIALQQGIPNLTLAAPMDAQSLRNLLHSANAHRGPFVIRYPRGPVSDVQPSTHTNTLPIGRGRKLNDGQKVAVLSYGAAGERVQMALKTLKNKGLHPSHYDLIYAKPLDLALLEEAFARHETLITVEDGVVRGGLGHTIAAWAHARGLHNRIVHLGIPDVFVPHGKVEQQLRFCGLDADSLAKTISDAYQQALPT